MNKNTKLLLVLLLSSLFFSGLSFADGPDLDDHEIVLSGPGMFLGGGFSIRDKFEYYLFQ